MPLSTQQLKHACTGAREMCKRPQIDKCPDRRSLPAEKSNSSVPETAAMTRQVTLLVCCLSSKAPAVSRFHSLMRPSSCPAQRQRSNARARTALSRSSSPMKPASMLVTNVFGQNVLHRRRQLHFTLWVCQSELGTPKWTAGQGCLC